MQTDHGLSVYTILFSFSFILSCSSPIGHAQKGENIMPTQAPSSQPSSQSSSQNSLLTEHKPKFIKTKNLKWGLAEFNQALHPETLHKPSQNQAVAIFAGGCFWCMEAPFEKLKGVEAVYSGYTGGQKTQPNYAQVSAYQTKHLEAVIVFYKPKLITYNQLLEVYWRSINPTQTDGQFADRGLQYTTAIFAVDEIQKDLAQQSKDKLEASKKFSEPIAVKIKPASTFWPAEDYHQDYYKTNTNHYLRYKYGSGRAGYLKKTWGVED